MTHPAVDPPDLAFGATVRALSRVWWEERRTVGVSLLFALMTTACSIAIPLLLRRIVDRIDAGEGAGIAGLCALVGVVGLARFGSNAMRRMLTSKIGIVIENRLRARLYSAYLTYPRAFYDRHATGQVLSRATNDLYPIRYFIGWGVIQICSSAMMIVGSGIVLVSVNPKLALAAGAVMPLIVLLTWQFSRQITSVSRKLQQSGADLTEAADESIVGMELIQAFGREPEMRARFHERANSVRQLALLEARIQARYLPGLTFLPTLAIAIVVLVGGREVSNGTITIGEFTLFWTLLLQLVWPLEALGWILNLAQRAVASAARSFAWLDGIEPLSTPATPRTLPEGPLAVRFEHVSFGYADADGAVLEDLDLTIAAGEIVAVCGETASGKTTLLSLLSRFYDPDSGIVSVGGLSVADVPLRELRAAVALCTQRPVLFSAPLHENLRAARPDASWDEMLASCRAAGVDRFVDDLPDGYETRIGERGVNLSGGQRQRVALARALISRARVIVLDDPFSAVDTETEQLLVTQLRPAVRGCTVLVASQRLSTVSLADRAVVLENGSICEQGTPAHLIEAGGAFARLFADELALA